MGSVFKAHCTAIPSKRANIFVLPMWALTHLRILKYVKESCVTPLVP